MKHVFFCTNTKQRRNLPHDEQRYVELRSITDFISAVWVKLAGQTDDLAEKIPIHPGACVSELKRQLYTDHVYSKILAGRTIDSVVLSDKVLANRDMVTPQSDLTYELRVREDTENYSKGMHFIHKHTHSLVNFPCDSIDAVIWKRLIEHCSGAVKGPA